MSRAAASIVSSVKKPTFHVGFAIQKLSREEGLETREIFRQVYAAIQE